MRIIALVGEGVRLVRRYERVQGLLPAWHFQLVTSLLIKSHLCCLEPSVSELGGGLWEGTGGGLVEVNSKAVG